MTALLKQNASDATWRPQAMDKPNYHEWFGSEKGDALAYTALLVTGLPMPNGKTGDSLTIVNTSFQILMNSSQAQEAKDHASGL